MATMTTQEPTARDTYVPVSNGQLNQSQQLSEGGSTESLLGDQRQSGIKPPPPPRLSGGPQCSAAETELTFGERDVGVVGRGLGG